MPKCALCRCRTQGILKQLCTDCHIFKELMQKYGKDALIDQLPNISRGIKEHVLTHQQYSGVRTSLGTNDGDAIDHTISLRREESIRATRVALGLQEPPVNNAVLSASESPETTRRWDWLKLYLIVPFFYCIYRHFLVYMFWSVLHVQKIQQDFCHMQWRHAKTVQIRKCVKGESFSDGHLTHVKYLCLCLFRQSVSAGNSPVNSPTLNRASIGSNLQRPSRLRSGSSTRTTGSIGSADESDNLGECYTIIWVSVFCCCCQNEPCYFS